MSFCLLQDVPPKQTLHLTPGLAPNIGACVACLGCLNLHDMEGAICIAVHDTLSR